MKQVVLKTPMPLATRSARIRTGLRACALIAGATSLWLPQASRSARATPVEVELAPAEVSLAELRAAEANGADTAMKVAVLQTPPVPPAPTGRARIDAQGTRDAPPAPAVPRARPGIAAADVELRKGYAVPAEVDLLNELGIRASARTEASAQVVSRYLSRDMTPSERSAYSRACEALVGANPRSFQANEKTLSCMPWALERIAAERNARRTKASRDTSLRGIRTKDMWPQLEGMPFTEAFARLDPLSIRDLQSLQAFASETQTDCRYAGATAAVIARAETFLPQDAAIATMDALYPGAFRCLEPDQDGFERTHLRVGLVRLLRGDTGQAKQSLLLAAHAENPQEDFRSWFWLGVIADSEKGAEGSDSGRYWAELRKRYPITIHSVLAAHAMGEDPVDAFTTDNKVMMARRVGDAWSEFNQASFVFEWLLARQESSALTEWSQFVARNFEAPNPQAGLFWAWCHHKAQNHRTTIALLTRYFKDMEGRGANLETLNMLFPRAYSDEIISRADGVDPVLVFALIRQESAFDPQARSGANARGLMQLLPTTARKWLAHPDRELYEPGSNVHAGVQHLQHLLRRYGGNVEHVLAAYNAGSGNLDKWRKRFPNAGTLLFSDLIPFKETRTYVAIILRNAYWYGRLMVLQKDSLAQTMQKKSAQARWRSETVHNLLSVAWGRRPSDGPVATLGELYSVRRDGTRTGFGGALGPAVPTAVNFSDE